jgi:dTDP-4-dehydrorhamnose reductase
MSFKIVIVGSGGRLGAALLREYCQAYSVIGFTHAQIDLADSNEVEHIVSALDFDILINCAALTNVDLCEEQPDEAFRINADAPKILAEICAAKSARIIHFSTDYVFDGEKRAPYVETDPANPISSYGESKREGEEGVLAVDEKNLVVRVSWVFGPDRPSFIDGVIKRAREGDYVDAIADKFATPTFTLDIAQALPRLFDVEVACGLVHFANAGECSWQEYAQHALDCCSEIGLPLKARMVAPLKLADMKNFVARRPVYSVLSSAKYTSIAGQAPRSWRDAVADYVKTSYSKK